MTKTNNEDKDPANEDISMRDATGDEQAEMDFRNGIQQALRSINSSHTGYVRCDVVSLGDASSLCVYGVGRIALPLQEHALGERLFKYMLYQCSDGCVYVCMFWKAHVFCFLEIIRMCID